VVEVVVAEVFVVAVVVVEVIVVAVVVEEDICTDLDAAIMGDGIDSLYCGVIGMLGLVGLLIGLYHVIVSEVAQWMVVLFPEQD
jgi:hypothetical protein